MERVHVLVSGRVQGVFFRDFVNENARELGITGWVRNTVDNRVEMVAEGKRERLEELIRRCKSGPPMATVRDMEVEWLSSAGEFDAFRVRPTAESIEFR